MAGEVLLDDHLVAEDADASDGWSADIKIADYCTGDWTLKAEAEDLAGNTGTVEIPIYIVSVTPKPTVAITTPASNAVLTGIVTTTGTCGDDVAVAAVTLKLDDIVVGFADITGGNWTCDIDTSLLADGASVRIGNAVVVAVPALTGDGYYIESTNRSSGIRVRTTKTLSIGDKINLVGTVNAAATEKAVEVSDVGVVSSNNVIKPIGITAKLLLRSPDSIGKIVKIWGNVVDTDTAIPAKWFILKDAAGIDVKCILGSGVTIPSGVFVTVAGVCSIDALTGQATVLVASSSDIHAIL